MKLYQRKENDPAPIGQADPYIFKDDNGKYYVYATGGQIYRSEQLKEGWEFLGHLLEMPGQKNCWAPCVIKLNGKYYMYYSSMPEDTEDVHQQTLRVAVSDTPDGPFVYQKDMTAPFSIDPHTVENGTGTYIFYCNNDYDAERAGTFILCDKLTDPMTMEGKAVPVVLPSIDEEIFARDRFKKGQHWHTIEGAFYFYESGIHYVMYSGANYTNPTYFIGYAIAYGEKDVDLRTLNWQKYPDAHTYAPVLKSNGVIEGMGHNSVLKDDGKYYIVYHGRDMGDADRLPDDSRCARIDEMKVDGPKLSVVPTI